MRGQVGPSRYTFIFLNTDLQWISCWELFGPDRFRVAEVYPRGYELGQVNAAYIAATR